MYLAGKYVNRLNNLYEIQKAFLHIQGEIRYLNTPMPEVMEGAARKMKEPLQSAFLQVSMKLEQHQGSGFQDIWGQILEQEITKDMLEQEAKEELLAMGSQLGSLDHSTQEKAIDYFLEKWERMIQSRREEKANRLKMYYACGVMTGAVLVMILV